jgi:hypothetical protein
VRAHCADEQDVIGQTRTAPCPKMSWCFFQGPLLARRGSCRSGPRPAPRVFAPYRTLTARGIVESIRPRSRNGLPPRRNSVCKPGLNRPQFTLC